jgi:hypothetical protein
MARHQPIYGALDLYRRWERQHWQADAVDRPNVDGVEVL